MAGHAGKAFWFSKAKGVVFPHPFGKAAGKLFTTLLTASPAGDELCLDFAKELVAHEGMKALAKMKLPITHRSKAG